MSFSGDRLKARRKALKLSQEALAAMAGLSQNAISDLERGRALETTKLNELARICGVTPEWLMGQEASAGTLSAQSISANMLVEEPENWLNDHFRQANKLLPEIDVRGGASYGGGIRDEEWQNGDRSGDQPIAHWGFPPAFVERELGLAFGSADVIRVRGDSMDDGTAKSLASGDRVIIDRKDTDVRQGGIFAVFDGDGVIIKQVELIRGHEPPRVICKSLNTRYDPIPLVLDGSVHIIGRVAGRISRV